MNTARWIVLCLLAGLATLALAAYVSRPPDPLFEGKRLSAWLTELDLGRWPRQELVPADVAIRHLGSNAFPQIKQLLRRRDSALKSEAIQLLNRRFASLHIPTQERYQHRAIAACYALGLAAKPLVPDVVEALRRMNPYQQGFAINWLSSLGPDAEAAIPSLTAILRDKKSPARQLAASALVGIAIGRWEDVRPLFTECLQDPDPRIRVVAQYAFQCARQGAIVKAGPDGR